MSIDYRAGVKGAKSDVTATDPDTSPSCSINTQEGHMLTQWQYTHYCVCYGHVFRFTDASPLRVDFNLTTFRDYSRRNLSRKLPSPPNVL